MPPNEIENEESLESWVSRKGFGALGTLTTTQNLMADPKVRARIRATTARGFLPIALGLLIGGILGATLGGAPGWLLGVVMGLFAGLRFSRSR